jgi:hypothetical protein
MNDFEDLADPRLGDTAVEHDRGTVLASVSRRTVMLFKGVLREGPDPGADLLPGRHRPRPAPRRLHPGRGDARARGVIAFMSASHHDPDLNAEVFVLAPEDV